MRKFSNKLSEAAAERLAILVEEAAEVQKAACKILRHGYEAQHPEGITTNRRLLEHELGDLVASIDLLGCEGDVDVRTVAAAAFAKPLSWMTYTHHQTKSLLASVRAAGAARLDRMKK